MKIGKKLKILRKQQNWTLEELARRSNLSPGFLSQLERDTTTINIEALGSILQSFGIKFSAFFAEEKHSKMVIKKNDHFKNESVDYLISWLTIDELNKKMEAQLITLFPHKKSEILKTFNGDVFGYVLKGKIKILHGEYSEIAEKNDSFCIDSSNVIELQNCLETDSVVIWVTSPGNF